MCGGALSGNAAPQQQDWTKYAHDDEQLPDDLLDLLNFEPLAPCGASVGSQETRKHGNTDAAQEARNTETRKYGLMNWP